MKLPAELLLAGLLRRWPALEKPRADWADFDLEGVRLLPADASGCEDGYLYVTDREAAPPGLHVLRLGAGAPDIAEVLNALQRDVTFYSDWRQRLRLAVFQNADLQELLDLAAPVLQSPMLVYDPALKLLAYSRLLPSDFSDRIFEAAVETGYLDAESFRFLEKNNIIAASRRQRFYESEPDEYQAHAICVNTVFSGGEPAAFCVLLYREGLSRAYVRSLFRIFCECLQELLLRQNELSLRSRSAVDYVLLDALENPAMDPALFRERLTLAGFVPRERYVLLSLHSLIAQRSLETYFISFLRFNLPLCQVFSHQDHILILYPLPAEAAGDYRGQLERALTPLLADQRDKAPRFAVSRPFGEIGLFSAAFRQTETVVRLSAGSADLFSYYEDLWISDLLQASGEPEPLFCFCEPCLLDLTQKGTAQARLRLSLLYDYLYYDSRLTLVAEKQNMHRNNVIYHLRRLEETYGLDLTDPETRLKLRLGLELLKRRPLSP